MNHPETEAAPRGGVLLAYAMMLLACVAAFLVVSGPGEALRAPAPAGPSALATSHHGTAHPNGLLQVLVALAAVMAASRVVAALFRRLHQPPVIGEIVAGILLGPSFLGKLAPGLIGFLFPASVMPLLGILAQLGVLLYMFLVGLELDTRLVREKTAALLAISHAGIVAPFVLACGLALWLYPMLSSSDVPFTPFALFIGVSMSVTAFPVLARILSERQLQGTRMGTISLTCAAVADVTAWCLLAFVVGVIQSRLAGAALTALSTLLYVAAMFVIVRPLAVRFVRRWEGENDIDQPVMGAICLVLLLSSMATEYIGIHTLFGAFLFGAVVPHDSKVARELRRRLQDFVVVLLLPAFFAFTGLRTEIGLIEGGQWGICAAIIAVACLGKFGGSAVAGRLTGMSWFDAASLGVLMNTRGLMELIVLNIGLDLGVISPRLFAMLVIMAVVTTFATTPILDWVTRLAAARKSLPVRDGACPRSS